MCFVVFFPTFLKTAATEFLQDYFFYSSPRQSYQYVQGRKNNFIYMLQHSRAKLWYIGEYGNGISLACCRHKERLQLRRFFFSFFFFLARIIASSDRSCIRSAHMWPPSSTTLTDSRAQSPRTVSLECNQTWDICAGWRVTLCSCAQTRVAEIVTYSIIHIYCIYIYITHTHTAAVDVTMFL